jgi:transcriptional regulator with XRE-family HTH domain
MLFPKGGVIMLGQRLYDLRRKQGLSQEQLAQCIGVSRQSISKWETDQSIPDLERLMALADCYGLTLDALVGKSAPETVVPPTPELPETSTPGPAASSRLDHRLFFRLAGLCMCLLGIACVVLAAVILLIDPQAGQSIATSVAVTIDGFGVVYGLSALAVIVGVYLMIRKT